VSDSRSRVSHHAAPPASQGGGGTSDIEKYVGAEIRKHRRRADMTVLALAQCAGLSQGMMSKIENGHTSASLTTLAAIANALGVPLSALFSSMEQSRDVSYVPAGKGIEIDRRGTKAGHIYELLGHGVRSPVAVEPYLITLSDTSDRFSDFQHEGVEYIYMLEGEVIYRHGDRRFRMGPGDSLLFDSIGPHGPVELVRLPARYLSVITYTRANE